MTAANTGNAQVAAYQRPFHGTASDRDAFAVRPQPNLPGAVDPGVVVVHPRDLHLQYLVARLELTALRNRPARRSQVDGAIRVHHGLYLQLPLRARPLKHAATRLQFVSQAV